MGGGSVVGGYVVRRKNCKGRYLLVRREFRPIGCHVWDLGRQLCHDINIHRDERTKTKHKACVPNIQYLASPRQKICNNMHAPLKVK